MPFIAITSPLRFLFFWLVVIVLIIGGIFINSLGGQVKTSGDFVVEEGAAAKGVWRKLAEEGYTSTTLPWRYQAWRMQAAEKIKAGSYRIDQSESVRDVVMRMVEGDVDPNELTITYPEGFTLQQIAARTASNNIGSVSEFESTALPKLYGDQFTFLADIPLGRDLEGYLFPDTYRVFPDDEPKDVIKRMLGNFNEKFTDDLRSEAKLRGRTLDEIVIMASIIEREVIKSDDMALVSGILWNRFNDGAGLDADATVRYALNKWDGPLTVTDLAVEDPYNTRKYRGLPPGPISNPGLRAIIAAVRPADTDYYYYLSAPSGETIFSKTNDEHNANKAKYLR